MSVYSVIGNYVLARLVSDIKHVLRVYPEVSVGAEFPNSAYSPVQVLVAVRSETHEQGAASNLYGVLESYAAAAAYPGDQWRGDLITWVSETPGAASITLGAP